MSVNKEELELMQKVKGLLYDEEKKDLENPKIPCWFKVKLREEYKIPLVRLGTTVFVMRNLRCKKIQRLRESGLPITVLKYFDQQVGGDIYSVLAPSRDKQFHYYGYVCGKYRDYDTGDVVKKEDLFSTQP